MKKVVCMVLAAVMLMACLAGCGSTHMDCHSCRQKNKQK